LYDSAAGERSHYRPVSTCAHAIVSAATVAARGINRPRWAGAHPLPELARAPMHKGLSNGAGAPGSRVRRWPARKTHGGGPLGQRNACRAPRPIYCFVPGATMGVSPPLLQRIPIVCWRRPEVQRSRIIAPASDVPPSDRSDTPSRSRALRRARTPDVPDPTVSSLPVIGGLGELSDRRGDVGPGLVAYLTSSPQ
jgi:hypothetical protein